MNSIITKNILIILLNLTITSVIVSFISMFFIVFIVRKDIEKRYKTKIDFPIYFKTVFLGQYAIMAGLIIRIYLTEKNIIKKSKYYKDIFLVKMNYTSIGEKKFNIFICFLHVISTFLIFIFGAIAIYANSVVYK